MKDKNPGPFTDSKVAHIEDWRPDLKNASGNNKEFLGDIQPSIKTNFRGLLPTALKVLGSLLAVLLFTAFIFSQGCQITPEKIRAEADRVNLQVDKAQAKVNQEVDNAAEVAKAVKESGGSIKDNLEESAKSVRDNLKDSIKEVREH